jgi:membrane-associated protein
MTSTLTTLLTDLGPVAVLVLIAVVFAETGLLVGFFLPGDSLLFAAGLLVASGALPVPLAVVIVATWLAAATGDQVAYWIGGRVGARLLGGRGSRWVPSRHVEAARAFFEHHGHKAVILARFVPVARTFTPVVAGTVAMPRRRFTVYNVAGGLLWTTSMCLAGYFLGTVPIVADHVDLVTLGIVALSLVPAAIAVARRRRRGTHRTDAHESESVPVRP